MPQVTRRDDSVATVTDDAEAAEPRVPTVPLPAETLVMDMETGRQLLRVDGFMPLPAGTRIELGSMMDPPPPPPTPSS